MKIILFSFLTTSFFCFIFLRIAESFCIFDDPNTALKIHDKKISFFGGAAICSAVFFVGLLLQQEQLLQFFVVVLPFFVVGLIDDFLRLSPMKKFILQIVCTVVFLYFLKLMILPLFKLITLFIGIILIVNAFNLIDVSDGLAGSVILPILIFFAGASAILACGSLISSLSQILIGAVLGFLVYNWPQAKLFLGDSGVFFLSASILFLIIKSGLFFAPLFFGLPIVVIFLLGVPLAEVFNLILIRTSNKIPFYLGSRHHFVHYLQKKGLTASQSALFAGFSSAALTIFSAAVLLQVILVAPAIVFVSLGFLLWSYLIYFPNETLKKIFFLFKQKDQ